MRIALAALLAALSSTCTCPAEPAAPQQPPMTGPTAPVDPIEPAEPGAPADGDRVLAVPAGSPHHGRVEGTSFPNACQSDADCHVGGCSSEVCSAEPGVSSTCEMPADGWPSQGASCGCVAGECSWYRGGGGGGGGPAAESPLDPAAALPDQGKPCTAGGRCAAGLTCLSYHGIAGSRGPQFTSCEIPCGKGERCPDGQRCITIADGPGQVCRR
jgi:eight-cysteine-cluster-containing protein